MAEKNYTTLDDGRPTAAHTWEEQFHTAAAEGRLGPPDAESLQARIGQLEAAAANPEWAEHKARKGWLREIEWRKKQLARITEDADNGDAEHQE